MEEGRGIEITLRDSRVTKRHLNQRTHMESELPKNPKYLGQSSRTDGAEAGRA